MAARGAGRFGAVADDGGVAFTLWAPRARAVTLRLEPPAGPACEYPLAAVEPGVWTRRVAGAAGGDRYRFRADAGPWWPDPASRAQPDGVHGASLIVDPAAYAWRDAGWPGIDPAGLVIYELHVGAFSPEGTFAGAAARLADLAALGVTAIELMPVAEFPGRWNWGYDGAALFAPSHRYGTPDDLRRLVDAAHGLGLAVLLDVVYNHLGPDGSYLAAFAPDAFSGEPSPWGAGLDLRPGGVLRRFFADNAAHWIREYHFDGLRLDATHAIRDDAPPYFLAGIADAARHVFPDRRTLVIAEDSRNLAALVRPAADGGRGLDGIWADDFHHHVRRHLAGDADGYFVDFSGTAADLARTIRRGWFFSGEFSAYAGRPRGTDPSGIPLGRFVTCIQNHDQVGNRAFGERLNHQVEFAAVAAAVVLLLLAPETPLLFMGQEWAASSPFLYFTDHDEPLGAAVTEGRREEFGRFAAFRDAATRARIPDPQDPGTFARSRLAWAEAAAPPHAAMRRVHEAALAMRRSLRDNGLAWRDATAVDEETILLRHADDAAGRACLTIVRLGGDGRVTVRPPDAGGAAAWRVVLDTDALLERTASPRPVDAGPHGLTLDFPGPGAAVLDSSPEGGR